MKKRYNYSLLLWSSHFYFFTILKLYLTSNSVLVIDEAENYLYFLIGRPIRKDGTPSRRSKTL